MSEPGSVVMNCPYCGRRLCADRVEFVSTNIILRSRDSIPVNVIEGISMRRLRAWCDTCGITIMAEKVTVEDDDPEGMEEGE